VPLRKDQAHVAESFINHGDSRFTNFTDYSGKPIDTKGDWCMVIKIDDPELKKKYSEEDWNGVSIFGPVAFESEEASKATPVEDKMTQFLKEKDNMDEAKLQELLEKSFNSFAEKLAKTLQTPSAPPKESDPGEGKKNTAFTGNPVDAEAVAKHLASLRKETLLKDIDWTDANAVERYLSELNEAAEPTEKALTAEVEVLKKAIEDKQAALSKFEKASAQPDGGDGVLSKKINLSGLSPEDTKLIEKGRKAGRIINKKNYPHRFKTVNPN
jgi:hypothetical protein